MRVMRLARDAIGVPSPPDVDRDEEIRVIGREFRQKHRRRHVGDDLAGQNAERERVERDEPSQKLLYRGNARHVPRKDEKRAKRKKQAVIHAQNRAEIKDQQCRRDCKKPPIIGKDAENDEHGQHEQRRVERYAPYRRRFFGGRKALPLFPALRTGTRPKSAKTRPRTAAP